MTQQASIFDRFGGIRPMARALDEPSSNVGTWKTKGRIPAEKQAHVLAMAQAKGLPITAEDVVFPLGRPADDLPAPSGPVACDCSFEAQGKAAG